MSAAALLLFCLACGKKNPETPALAGQILYQDSASGFSCDIPGDWRVLPSENGSPGTAFFGPSAGTRPYSAAITIRYYKNGSEFLSPEAFADARRGLAVYSLPLQPLASACQDPRSSATRSLEFTLIREESPLHGDGPKEEVQEHGCLFPGKDGFFALLHTAPKSSAQETAPVFQSLVASFRTQGSKT
ncbi:MAG: hypothetical protein WCU88_12885 [Elusimicrobiota bacterium]